MNLEAGIPLGFFPSVMRACKVISFDCAMVPGVRKMFTLTLVKRSI
jgi:hypothetical protein